MKKSAEIFDEIVHSRRSVRKYNSAAPFDETAVTRSLERAVLAPTSSNLQLWEFYRVKSDANKKKLTKICFNQNAAKTANELIIVVVRNDKWRERAAFVVEETLKDYPDSWAKRKSLVDAYYNRLIPMLYFQGPFGIIGNIKKLSANISGVFRPVPREVTETDLRISAHKSAALAAQTFMLSMKAEGYDTCAMEGFDSVRVSKMLKLPKYAEINMIIAVGVADENGVYGKRVRVPNDDIIFEM